jgi:ATP-dependent protease Clp ATPase subunit
LGFLTVAKLVGAAYPDGIDDDAAPSPEAKAIPTARQLYDRIRERVIDLDRQAEVIASRLVLHMTRARMLRTGEDPGTPNECWIVIGPPGVGKTWICEVAGSCCGIPFATADASDLSAEGYVGMSVSDTLKHLVVAAKGNADEARYGFLALDEYTKKARSMGESPVNTVAVQQETLRIISGQAMLLGGRRGWDRPIQFSTVGTCFALMGHCPGLDRLVEKRMGRRMGFSVGNGALRSRAWLNDALLDFGLIEELVSRLTAVIVIPPPSLDTLMKALVAEHGIVGSYNRLLAGHGAMLFLTPPATQALAEHGMEGGYFRAMKRVVSALAGEVVFEGRKGTTMVEASDIRRAAAKAEDGAADLLAAPRRPAGGVPDDGQADEHSGAGFANG